MISGFFVIIDCKALTDLLTKCERRISLLKSTFSCFPVPTPSLSLWASGTAQPRQILGLCLPKWDGNEAPAIRNVSKEWCLELKEVEEGGAGSRWEKDRLEGQNTYLILATFFCFECRWKTKNWFVTSINC